MKTFVVIGLGRFGTAVAEELSALGHEVLALAGAEENVQKVADQVTHAVTGDARDPAVLFLFLTASMFLSTVENLPYLDAAFEVASAMATVGLTCGITPDLTPASQSLIILLMYLGRVGILSFSIAFMTRTKYHAKVKYPEMNVMIG